MTQCLWHAAAPPSPVHALCRALRVHLARGRLHLPALCCRDPPVHAFCTGKAAPPQQRIARIPLCMQLAGKCRARCMHFAWGTLHPPATALQRSLRACILHGESTVHPRAPRCKDLSCILQGNAGPAACIFARGTPRPPAARCKPPPPRRCTHLHGSAHAGVVQQRVLQLPQQPAEKEQDLLPHPGGVLQGGGGDTTSAAPQPESCLHLLPRMHPPRDTKGPTDPPPHQSPVGPQNDREGPPLPPKPIPSEFPNDAKGPHPTGPPKRCKWTPRPPHSIPYSSSK